MSKSIVLPDSVYDAIAAEAEAHGSTPAEWVAAHVPATRSAAPAGRSLLDDLRAKGLVGGLSPIDDAPPSSADVELYIDHLAQKKREGRL